MADLSSNTAGVPPISHYRSISSFTTWRRWMWQDADAPDAQRVALAVANALEKLVARNDLVAADSEESGGQDAAGGGTAAFCGPRRPGISIENYIERIHSYALCSPACLVAAFVYLDRAVHRRPDLLVGSLNVHRLLLTAVMIASKFFDTMPKDNAFYAKVGGVSNADLNKMEVELLFLLDFGINVTFLEFESYCSYLEKEMVASNHRKGAGSDVDLL